MPRFAANLTMPFTEVPLPSGARLFNARTPGDPALAGFQAAAREHIQVTRADAPRRTFLMGRRDLSNSISTLLCVHAPSSI